MYIRLSSKIEVAGKYRMHGAIEIEIKKSIYQVIQLATIKLPIHATIKDGPSGRIKLIDYIQPGQTIKIYSSVNYKERLEFTGYIKRINNGFPLEVICEDELYLLRKVNFAHSFRQVTLQTLLNYVLDKLKQDKGFDIQLYNKKDSGQVPELVFNKFIMRSGTTGIQVLQELRDNYGLSAYLTEIDGKKVLYCSLAFSLNKGQVKHKIDYNTTKETQLQFNVGEEKTYKIKVTVFRTSGLQQVYEFGDKDGELRTIPLYGDPDHNVIKQKAEAEILNCRSNGYKGSIVTMLIPHAEPGMISKVEDTLFPERNGDYYIEEVTTTLNSRGGRRRIQLAVRVSTSKVSQLTLA